MMGIALNSILIGLIFFLIGKETKIDGEEYPTESKIFFLICPSAFFLLLSPRPYVFTILFFVVDILILRHNEGSIGMFWLVPMQVLWTNIHAGSAPLGYLLPLGTLFFAMVRNWKPTKDKDITFLCSIFTFLSTFVNPYGIGLVKYPFTSMGSTTMQTYISEWAAPDIKNHYTLFLFFLPLIGTIILLSRGKKKISNVDFASFLGSAYLALRSERFTCLMLAVTILLVLPHLKKNEVWEAKKIIPMIRNIVTCLFPCLLALMLIVDGQVIHGVRPMNTKGNYTNASFYQTVKNNGGDRPYNDYNDGLELIWYGIPTFVDSRYDPYAFGDNKIIEDYFKMYMQVDSNSKTMDELMKKYRFTSFLCDGTTSVYYYAIHHGFYVSTCSSYKNSNGKQTITYFLVKD